MSGGSLDYVYRQVEDAAHYIGGSPRWDAFRAHLFLVAEALHDVEWVMSGDYGEGGADEAIDRVVAPAAVSAAALEAARRLHDQLGHLLAQYDDQACEREGTGR